MEKKRLSKVMAAAGVASRRACEELIFSGKVTVDGEIILVPQTLVDIDTQDIRVDGDRINKEEKKVYYILNKPTGYICSNKRIGSKKLVIDLFPPQPRLFTVGRLDRDTSGLLIVTNDGHFAQNVIHPSFNISKEYLVKTQQEITHEHLVEISKGAFIEDTFVKPVKVVKVRRGTIKVTVMEGKKREVRLLVQNAGLSIEELSRIRIGGLTLGELAQGDYRPMSAAERDSIQKNG